MYFLIGLSLLFAVTLAISLPSTALASALWRVLETRATHRGSARRASAIFALRTMPVFAALTFVFGLVLPAYVLFEPAKSDETIGAKMALVMAVATLGIAIAAFRIFASSWRTRRLVSEWMQFAKPINIAGVSIPSYKLDHAFPVFAVVGVLRQRLFVATQVLDVLDEAELAAVITHELGHIKALDNLKRVAMRLCGDLLVFPLGRFLDRSWIDASELAADEYAVGQHGRASALNLAAALVKIARMIPARQIDALPAGSFAVGERGEGLADRIGRLLRLAESRDAIQIQANTAWPKASSVLFVLTLLGILALATDFSVLERVHNVSETVVSILQ